MSPLESQNLDKHCGIGMNQKTPDRPSIVMDLGLSHHYAQVLTVPVTIISNIPHRNKRDILEKIKYGNFSI